PVAERPAADTLLDEGGHQRDRVAAGPAPAVVADLDPEGAALAPEIPVAQLLDARGRERPPVRVDRVPGQSVAQLDRVVHQVAADLAARVGDPVRQRAAA